jgi:cytochrome c
MALCVSAFALFIMSAPDPLFAQDAVIQDKKPQTALNKNENSESRKTTEDSDLDGALKEELAKADVKRGKKLTGQCRECHTFDEDGPDRMGPNLFGIYGAHHARLKERFRYGASMLKLHNRIWTAERLNEWLKAPTRYARNTLMYSGFLDTEQDRMDVIAYLRTLK